MKTLHYNVLLPKKAAKNPPLLVMLHGYGSDENDLFSFANHLNDQFLIISLRAPLKLGFGGYAWYNIDFTGNESRFGNPEEAKQAMYQVEQLIEEVQEKYNTNKAETVLLGFSQGAIISYGLSLNNPAKYNGVLALSGYVFEDILPKEIDVEKAKHLAFFASHGTEDPVIPIEWARNAHHFLKTNQLNVVYKEYKMGHGINPECFDDLMFWINQRYPIG